MKGYYSFGRYYTTKTSLDLYFGIMPDQHFVLIWHKSPLPLVRSKDHLTIKGWNLIKNPYES